tara:strand:+ start:13088 stop:13342 length:255 start_codon:yes stop_codon:yes gene_type:complete
MEKKPIGKITHFFDKIGVAVVELSDSLSTGDQISIEGHEKQFEQIVDSMQVDHDAVQDAVAGQAIGIKVSQPVKVNDQVFKVVE